MRDDIIIVLNEREPLKQQAATLLSEQLTGRHLSNERIRPSTNILEVILTRKPRILILDYLLGDVGTALDILSQLREQTQIQTILWTDEPSVSVAVSAMKLGAKDFVELGSGKDLEKLLRAIDECLSEDEQKEFLPKKNTLREREHVIYQSPTSRSALAQATSAAARNMPIIVIRGESGVGRNTLARFIHQNRSQAGELIEVNIDEWMGSISELTGGSTNSTGLPLLSSAATVVIDRAEFDSGELLDAIENRREHIWKENASAESPMLIVGTSSLEPALAWQRLVGAELIDIPPLSKRPEDFLPLIQRFSLEAKHLGINNKLDIKPQLLERLQKENWPGNIRQLRAAVLEALATPLEAMKEILGSADAELGNSETIVEYLLAVKSRWEEYAQANPTVPDAIRARQHLDKANGNWRIAAVTLGTGVTQVRVALKGLIESSKSKAGAQAI